MNLGASLYLYSPELGHLVYLDVGWHLTIIDLSIVLATSHLKFIGSGLIGVVTIMIRGAAMDSDTPKIENQSASLKNNQVCKSPNVKSFFEGRNQQ